MADKALLICLFLVALVEVTNSMEMSVCVDSGVVHRGKLSVGQDVNVLERRKNTRSKLECATMCYSDWRCMTAVYRKNGDCLFIKNFTNTLTIEDDSQSYILTEEILEMKTNAYTGNKPSLDAHCPTTCTGYSVCFLECGSSQDSVLAGCMDLSTSQYDTDDCGFRPSIQMKEYYLSNLNRWTASSDYNFFSVTFVKKFDWTTLQVKFRGTLRAGYGYITGTWAQWRILFNGNDCTDPGNIESINYNEESDTNHHKASGIIGICYGLSAGSYSITLTSHIGSSQSQMHVGHATHASRFYVEELGQPTWSTEPTVKPCPSLPSFNYREHATTTGWSHEPNTNLWNVDFTKMESDTWLRINGDFVLRQYLGGTNSESCSTWSIRIDHHDCQPYKLGKTVANLGNANSVNNEHRSTEFEGHCSGITSGSHTLNLYIGTCDWGHSYRDTDTGWNGNTNRLIIEEFRPSSNIIGVMDSDGETVYRVPQFNMVAHGAGHISYAGDEGLVSWTIPVYNKIYETSGVSVMMSYDARCYYGHGNGNYDPCCRHYIKFNGNECTTPGTIEGINYLNKNTNLHRPNLIEGICDGIPAGDVTITIWAGKCKGYSKVGDCHFGWNSYQHMLISETFIERETIQF